MSYSKASPHKDVAKPSEGGARQTNAKNQAEVQNPLWQKLISSDMQSQGYLQRKCDACEDEENQIQTKLNVGPADDQYEREADAVADKVMRMPMGSNVGSISSIGEKQPATKSESKNTNGAEASSGLSNYVGSLNGKGKRLSKTENQFFSSRFGRSFDSVRVHTGNEANQAAKGINAKAFTYGNHIVFNQGAYQQNKPESLHLLAHELTHVVQQNGASSSLNRKPDDPTSVIQRTGEDELTPEIVGQDPNLLLCFILCELGVPPAIWRDITSFLLRAVWEEYRDRYSQAQASVAFRRFRLAFKAYSPLRVIQFTLTFISQGRIGLIPVRSVSALALRSRLAQMLIARGATGAGIIAAEQIARKVVIVIEAAIAAGCAAYCGTMAYARTLVMLAEMTAQGLVAFVEALEATGEIIGAIVGGIATEIIVRPILTGLAMSDVFNWDLSGMPTGTKADTVVMGWYLSSQLDGADMDALLTQLARPINDYPQSFQDLIFMTMATIAEEREELGEEPLEYSPHQMLRQSPIVYIRMLNENGYLLFDQDPEEVVDEMLNGEDPAEESAE